MIFDPEESPAVFLIFHVTGRIRRRACISRASPVRRAMRRVVLMVGLEHSESLRVARASVVRAFSGLDGLGHFRSVAGNI